ncbi:MAG: hypothetical protein SGI88_12430 [Candidatus Hydrogenedentes bacterium]|nr:hypothetical protein [Candidatus Hydrogenedentota bacterium]
MSRPRGSWSARLLIHLLTIALGVLVFWILGFLMSDLESIPGPDYTAILNRHLDQSLVAKRDALITQSADLDRKLANARDESQLVRDSSQNFQSTINQLLELQRQSIEKQVVQSEREKTDLSASLNHFLDSQKKYQELNQRITEMAAEKARVDEEKVSLDLALEAQSAPAQREYEDSFSAHRVRLAAYQLAILIPVLLVAGYFLVKRKGSIYYPLYLAVGGGTLVRVVLVIHEYFPARYFKYILIVALLIFVVRILLHVIRLVAHPKAETLMRQYREAYERFLCPTCDYPIRTGPRKWLYWTRRTVHKVLPVSSGPSTEEPYTCPSCGSMLFEPCGACQRIRHALLPHCEHCGAASPSPAKPA